MDRCHLFNFGCREVIGLDRGISCLVFTLNFLGVRTRSSCQGHMDESRYNFPWIYICSEDVEKLTPYLERYNRFAEVEWKVSLHLPTAVWVVRPTKIDRGPVKLQKEAVYLSIFLAEQSIKKEHLV